MSKNSLKNLKKFFEYFDNEEEKLKNSDVDFRELVDDDFLVSRPSEQRVKRTTNLGIHGFSAEAEKLNPRNLVSNSNLNTIYVDEYKLYPRFRKLIDFFKDKSPSFEEMFKKVDKILLDEDTIYFLFTKGDKTLVFVITIKDNETYDIGMSLTDSSRSLKPLLVDLQIKYKLPDILGYIKYQVYEVYKNYIL